MAVRCMALKCAAGLTVATVGLICPQPPFLRAAFWGGGIAFTVITLFNHISEETSSTPPRPNTLRNRALVLVGSTFSAVCLGVPVFLSPHGSVWILFSTLGMWGGVAIGTVSSYWNS